MGYGQRGRPGSWAARRAAGHYLWSRRRKRMAAGDPDPYGCGGCLLLVLCGAGIAAFLVALASVGPAARIAILLIVAVIVLYVLRRRRR
jgi:Flp pilus assembly protein TadB